MLSFRTYLAQLSEGVDDPGILKCVFMAGGPGSGKSYTSNDLFGIDSRLKSSFSTYGLKVVNSDKEFVQLLKANGVPTDLDRLEKEQPDVFQHAMDLRDRAKVLTTTLRKQYEQGRLGLIVDGTGRDYDDMHAQHIAATALGYDCYMIFVNTSKETALQRNQRRPRTLNVELVAALWDDCQRNLGHFQRLFGASNFLVVDSVDDAAKTQHIQQLSGKAIRRWIAEPVKNIRGLKWIRLMGGRHGRH